MQVYAPKRPQWHSDIKKHWRSFGVALLSLTRFHTFSWYFIIEFGEVLPAALTSRDQTKVQTSKNYGTCKHRYKLCHINQTGQNTLWKETMEFKKLYRLGFYQTSMEFIEIFVT